MRTKRWWLAMTAVLLLSGCWTVAGPLFGKLIAVPPAYAFNVYYGPASGSYTNKVNAGWPRAGTNFQFALSGLGTNWSYFAVTVADLKTGLESDYSVEASTNLASVTLSWSWAAPSVPVTNVISVGGVFESSSNLVDWAESFAWTEKTLTNPTPDVMWYRMRATITNH